jgi:hypothetical protein
MRGSGLQQLSVMIRRTLALVLAAGAIGYLALLATTYLQVTSPSSLLPDVYEIDRLLFRVERPVSRIEQLLEATGGEMSGGGTMRPAFTDESTGWEELTKRMTADELAKLTAEREGERTALLDWVRTGARREAYESDVHLVSNSAAVTAITARYSLSDDGPMRIRIRSLINDRCATCHSENGRHDTARFIPMDTYDSILPRTQPEAVRMPQKVWLFASLLGLLPLGLLSSAIFWRSSHPRHVRRLLIVVPSIALGMALAIWVSGQQGGYSIHTLLGLAACAAIGTFVQIAVSLSELISRSPA